MSQIVSALWAFWDWLYQWMFWDWLYRWQTLIAGLLALLAAIITVRITLRVERGKADREVDALRKSLAVELRLQTSTALAAYDGLYGLGFMPNAPITARMLESKLQYTAPIIFSANAGKIGLLGTDAMGVMIVYSLLETARDGAAQLDFRPSDDIPPADILTIADAFLRACSYARDVLPKLRTGDPSHDANDEALIQRINDNIAARPSA